jgi:hypothetical protein
LSFEYFLPFLIKIFVSNWMSLEILFSEILVEEF